MGTGVIKQVNRAAPFVAAAMLIAALTTGAFSTEASVDVEEYHADVREAIENIPYRIGSWVGDDLETQPAAIKLLKPNKLLQRRYVDPATGRSVSLLVVHCGDMRDMRGHYPPVCYPAHGWRMDDSETSSFSANGQQYPGKEYRFSRALSGSDLEMEIFSFFILPDGTIAPDMETLSRMAGRRAMAGLGAAQVQIIGGEDLPEEEQRKLVDQFVDAIESMIRTIDQGADS